MGNIGILGGTFNPVHTGHIRLAVEVGEALGLGQVLLSPNAVPPHKPVTGLLPYELRVALAHAAVRDVPLLGVSTLEGDMAGPSYTFVALQEWRRLHPEEEKPWFLLGVEDFTLLHTWFRGTELPQQAHIVVVPRAGSDRETFHAAVNRFWPGSKEWSPVEADGREAVRLTNSSLCLFLPVPRLDISASFLRNRWLQGRDISGLTPRHVIRLLHEYGRDVRQTWSQLAADTSD